MAPPERLAHTPASVEVAALGATDPRMRALAEAVGRIDIRVERDRFRSLASAIVGQQLSTKAAETIWGRVAALTPIEPESVLGASPEALRAAGLSGAKTRYLFDLAERVVTGDVALDALDGLDDEAVIAEVCRVKGVGRWTAGMFLIFSLGRPDVLALDDAGLLRSAGWLLGLGGPADAAALRAAGEAWRPYRTVASLYLWGALDRGLVPRTAQPGGLTPRE